MAAQIERRTLVRWLLAHRFTELRVGATSLRRFRHESGVVITVVGHGSSELSRKHVGMILRELEGAGFERTQIRAELREYAR
jgi:predicted RNA binding protein YcfA (HicA-like mRNA interferase family)